MSDSYVSSKNWSQPISVSSVSWLTHQRSRVSAVSQERRTRRVFCGRQAALSCSPGPHWGALSWHMQPPRPLGLCSKPGSSNVADTEGRVYRQEARGGHFCSDIFTACEHENINLKQAVIRCPGTTGCGVGRDVIQCSLLQ